MQSLRVALFCGLLATTTGVALQAILLLHAATVAVRALPGAASDEIQSAHADLVAQVEAARGDLTGQVAAVRADLFRQVDALRADTTALANRVADTTDRRVGDSLARLDTALGQIQELHDDLKPTLDNAAAITARAKDASDVLLRRDALPAQLLGLTAAAKVTLGQSAETMRDIQRATPGFIATWQQIADHVNLMTLESAKASQATAKTMTNFAAASKPLPTWARLLFQVSVPAAQVGASAVAAGAAAGLFSGR